MAEKKFSDAIAFDLHVHTRCPRKNFFKSLSDGVSSPKEIVYFAKKIGLKGIAITNHNSMDGITDVIEEGKRRGLMIVPGCEISASDRTEILVYGIKDI
ncbi:MAG: PHP domain-containing protein, partial [Crenarchaeota archaeon]|nr:PHP domain-containing protein [Thermoproteota archaeon]